MLGYILPDKPELKVREMELYGGYYCGLCQSVKRRHGQLPRLVLNYDSVFLALVLNALEKNPETTVFERCVVHPLKRRTILAGCSSLNYAADMMVLLAGYKLEDDRRDDGDLKSALGFTLLRRSLKKIVKSYPEKGIIIKQWLKELEMLEAAGTTSADQAGEPFARVMEAVFDWSPADAPENQAAALRRLGYHLGRWIYLIDAYDDLIRDEASGAYNPLLRQYRATPGNSAASADTVRSAIRDRVSFNLQMHLGQLAEAWEDLTVIRNKNLIDNIIYSGLSQKTELVIAGNQPEKEGTTTHAQSL